MKFWPEKKNSYSVSVIQGTENAGFTENLANYGSIEDVFCTCNDNCSENKIKDGIASGKITPPRNEYAEDCDFEKAVRETKYGKYNWFLLSIGLWGYMSSIFSTTSMSLIFPSASCDMQLSNFDKGMLNAVTYVGMTSTAFFGGAISDAFGRRRFLRVGYTADAFFCILIALSPNFTFLLTMKLLSGFVNSSLVAILTTYVAENHANRYRASVTIGMGIFNSIGIVVLPVLGWLIIPLSTELTLFNGFIHLSSWKIFILTTSLPSILASVSLIFVEESPKFLLTQNKNDMALKVFQKIYSVNTGNPREMFPVRSLKLEESYRYAELRKGNMTFGKMLKVMCEQVVHIFHKPYLSMTLLLSTMKFFTLSSANTVRLWSPELFALSIEHENNYENSSTVASSVCELLSLGSEINITETIINCSEKGISKEIYFNSMITGVVTGIGYLTFSFAVRIMDRKWILLIAYGGSLACSSTLYWCVSSTHLLVTISVFVAFSMSTSSILFSVVIDIFPTFLRTTASNLCLTFGRAGAIFGNLVFPLLLDWNCASLLVFLAFFVLLPFALTLLLPKTKGKDLK